MTGVTWTKLRHQMLHLISSGRVERARVGQHWLNIQAGVSTNAQMSRAVKTLLHAGVARIDRIEDGTMPVVLTPDGHSLLSQWNTKHNEVQP